MLPRRVPGYRPEQLDQLCATGEVVWVGAGLDRVALFFREDAAVLGRPAGAPPPEGEVHDAIREALAASAEFWLDLLAATGLEAEVGAAGALGPRLGGRGDERRLAAAAGRAAVRHPEAGAAAAPLLARRARRRSRRRRAAGRSTDRLFAGRRPTGGRSPSCCSSARASSRATASAARGLPAATAPSTAS